MGGMILLLMVFAAILVSNSLRRSSPEKYLGRRAVPSESATRWQPPPRRAGSQEAATRQSSRSQQPERPAASSTPTNEGIDSLRGLSSGDLKRRSSSRPSSHQNTAAHFTRGSHRDDVLRIEGTPDAIQRYPSLGEEVWRYGSSRVTISTRSGRVTEWSNSGRNLDVRLEPGANITSAAHYTRGSHRTMYCGSRAHPMRSRGIHRWEKRSGGTVAAGSPYPRSRVG